MSGTQAADLNQKCPIFMGAETIGSVRNLQIATEIAILHMVVMMASVMQERQMSVAKIKKMDSTSGMGAGAGIEDAT